jgi:L-fucose isomerase-like protein
MEKLVVGFMVTAAEHFPYDQPNDLNRRCVDALSNWDIELVSADSLVVNPDSALEAANKFKKAGVDALISMVGSFTWDNMPIRVVQELKKLPIILWGVPEPPMAGGRLEGNSLVGVTMNSAALERLGYSRKFIYGFPEDESVKAEIDRTIRVLNAIKRLGHTRLGIVGGRPPGFYGSTYDELKLRKALGVEIIPVEVSEVISGIDKIEDAEIANQVTRVKGLGVMRSAKDEDAIRVAKLYQSLQTIINRENINGIAIKCWPELKDRYFNPCVVNGMLTDEGVMVGCETDVHGTITMLMQYFLTKQSAFFCDLVTFNEQENSVLLWHCGAAAASLARNSESRVLEIHSIGTGSATLEFPLKTGRGVFARLGVKGDNYRLLIVSGEALQTPMLLRGNNLLFRTDQPARHVVNTIIEKGIEHHYSFAYGESLRDDLLELCKWVGVEAETLN